MIRWQGHWRPGLPAPVSRFILWLMTAEAMSRGIDYVTGDRPGVTSSLTVIEAALPLPVWGLLFLIVASVTTLGVGLRRYWLITYGAFFTGGLYAILSVGLFLRMVERGWPWDGWRTPVHFLMMGGLWAAVAAGTIWRRRLDERAREEAMNGMGDIPAT